MENKPTSESLAAIVFAYRITGICKEEAKNAMTELMRRKENGDSFNMEEYIKIKTSQLPKSNINSNVLNTLSNISMIGTFK